MIVFLLIFPAVIDDYLKYFPDFYRAYSQGYG